MVRFYRVTITKRPIGSAIEHKEPAMQGNIITKVTDSTTAGDYKIFVMECDDKQHKTNVSIPKVNELSEEQAVKLAAQFQPKRTSIQFNPLTRKEEKITIPDCDLRRFYKKE